ncbi:MAG: hypothetical protein LUQ26_00675 [Methylococcaceae bacterium]|nr:hypothetical protein [Methylococcaceae bacterium]
MKKVTVQIDSVWGLLIPYNMDIKDKIEVFEKQAMLKLTEVGDVVEGVGTKSLPRL